MATKVKKETKKASKGEILSFWDPEAKREVIHEFSAHTIRIEKTRKYDREAQELRDSWINMTLISGENETLKERTLVFGKKNANTWVLLPDAPRNQEPAVQNHG